MTDGTASDDTREPDREPASDLNQEPIQDREPNQDRERNLDSWCEQERVAEQYREPDESPFDVEPEIPNPPDPSDNDVDPTLARRFWALVFVFNVALLALSLGVMFVVFEGNYTLGGQLLLGGLAAFGFGLYRYRTTKQYLDEQSDGDDETTVDADEPNG